MNHDYAHCLDFTEDCPMDCFRAQLVRDLKRYGTETPWKYGLPVSWIHFGQTEVCIKREEE